jgi:hypothetical protein
MPIKRKAIKPGKIVLIASGIDFIDYKQYGLFKCKKSINHGVAEKFEKSGFPFVEGEDNFGRFIRWLLSCGYIEKQPYYISLLGAYGILDLESWQTT